MTLLADLAEAPVHDGTRAVARVLEPPQHPPSSMARVLCSTAATAARPGRRALGAGSAWAAAEGGVLGVCRAASSEAGRRRRSVREGAVPWRGGVADMAVWGELG
ncbi:hypothetical protein [Streptomyces virginiae]|uniref:hypothetical protein n=1 Tax=Streptomyces virginiae TaxID=1961 RepID=UPI0022535311|nr:hypothetical protein [Streptomyces virginiae]MCX4721960.1 hypothetical protein [Streptomyces virginiae]MCX5276881.1 hypothetical protein [Streptomyces virginiae]